MTNGVDDDLGLGYFVEDEVRVRRCRYPTNGRFIGPNANVRVSRQQIDN